jgi:hypothetical protein
MLGLGLGVTSSLTSVDALVRGLYSAGGVLPRVALDFDDNNYVLDSGGFSFDKAFMGSSPKLTYGTTSNSTMVNSSGNIVWAPHNLALNSATPATQTITVTSGADYTVRVTGTGSMALSGAGTGTATDGSPATITASTTSLTITLTGSLGTVAVYRSDLGGMAQVPGAATGFEYYVPTNGAAEYLPRVGHHVYNGSAWVNEGLLLESEARTNLLTYSDISSGWVETRADIDPNVTTEAAPDGTSNVTAITSDLTPANSHKVSKMVANPLTSTGAFTFSAFVKDNGTNVQFDVNIDPAVTFQNRRLYVLFDLQAGTAATPYTAGSPNVIDYDIQDVGGGWYRCHVTTDNPDGKRVDVAMTLSQFTFSNANPGFDGDGTTGVFVYGAQFELGSTPSSYMPSNATTQGFRDAQTLTVPPAEFGWNSNAVSIQMDGRMNYVDGGTSSDNILLQWLIDAQNRIYWAANGQTTNNGTLNIFQVENNFYDQPTPPPANYFAAGSNVPFNIASRHGSTFVNGAVDGVALTANTTPTALPDLSGTNLQIAYDFMGTISHFRQWDEDIGDTGLEEATS